MCLLWNMDFAGPGCSAGWARLSEEQEACSVISVAPEATQALLGYFWTRPHLLERPSCSDFSPLLIDVLRSSLASRAFSPAILPVTTGKIIATYCHKAWLCPSHSGLPCHTPASQFCFSLLSVLSQHPAPLIHRQRDPSLITKIVKVSILWWCSFDLKEKY